MSYPLKKNPGFAAAWSRPPPIFIGVAEPLVGVAGGGDAMNVQAIAESGVVTGFSSANANLPANARATFHFYSRT